MHPLLGPTTLCWRYLASWAWLWFHHTAPGAEWVGGAGQQLAAVGSELGVIPRAPEVSGVVNGGWRCQDVWGCIRGNWRIAVKWGILLHPSPLSVFAWPLHWVYICTAPICHHQPYPQAVYRPSAHSEYDTQCKAPLHLATEHCQIKHCTTCQSQLWGLGHHCSPRTLLRLSQPYPHKLTLEHNLSIQQKPRKSKQNLLYIIQSLQSYRSDACVFSSGGFNSTKHSAS